MKKEEDPNETVDEDLCSCGAVLEPWGTEQSPELMICPTCGAVKKSDPFDLSCADTQTLNIAEMARMAQEGVDPTSVSGEWVTVLESDVDKKKR